jgi:two-component system, OmpR family, sensor kinase
MTRGLRGRLLLVVSLGAIVALIALTAGFNVALDLRLRGDVDTLLRERAAARLTALTTTDGRLAAPEAPDAGAVDTQTWIYAGGKAIEQPRASVAIQRAAGELARGSRRFQTVNGGDTRLYAVPILSAGRRIGTLVAGTSLRPYRRTGRTALIDSLAFAALALVAILLAARWAIGAALRPVARMTATAAAWSEHDAGQRFALGEPHDELTRLAATFDALLERLAASLRHEQRFSAEISHELRTPLASVLAETELALRRERTGEEYRTALFAIRRSAEQVSRTLETLLTVARAEAGTDRGMSAPEQGARQALDAYATTARERGLTAQLHACDTAVRVGAGADVVERILSPLVENAHRYATSAVTVSIARADGAVELTVADDGPGVAPTACERIFEPGVHEPGSRHDGRPPAGAGLGLALARRLARSAGGDVDSVPDSDGGRFRVTLPAA